MFSLLVLVAVVGHTLAANHTHHNAHHHPHTHAPTTPAPTLDPTSDKGRIQKLENELEALTRQVMLQQLFVEERIRSDGDSGVKQLRHSHDGTAPYISESYTGRSINSIHDHSNYDRTVGMGEVIVVMNGVEFRTRHNDYKLRMPSKTSKQYNAIQDIPFPRVPPSVLHKHTIAEQIAEMKEYFKAFHYQNHQHRDYRPYFKPNLCYMEGAWTTSTKTLNEPFQSDRHSIDASSWYDLQEKIRYTSYSGSKHNMENFSYLPSTIINVNNGTAEYAQWNYRILCHPLEDDLPLAVLTPIDDIASRLAHNFDIKKFAQSRSARFKLAALTRDGTYDFDLGYGTFRDRPYNLGLLDQIMMQIPGKNNYGTVLNDHSFNMTVFDARDKINNTALNTGYYHRYFKYDSKGAMGTKTIHRGFADQNLFVAQTTQPQIAKIQIDDCHKHQQCHHYSAQYSYAIPLEIVYTTPLYSWNPYDLPDYGKFTQKNTLVITEHYKRNGQLTPDKAYNGTNSKYFYKTPAEFFSSAKPGETDRADTDKGAVGVLDKHGVVRKVVASGTRIMLPTIEGIGRMRMRYPITPVHMEGSAAGKGLAAVVEMINHMSKYSSYFAEPPTATSAAHASLPDGHFVTEYTHQDPPGFHRHEMYISHEEMSSLAAGNIVSVFTSTDQSHEHTIDMGYNKTSGEYYIQACDGQPRCWDGHGSHIIKLS
ncbi:uncharacterized protein LOC132548153 [Ylistrum balloti]|uniref:uncharacterized protein LOC132548153 n=1 Tax=Ylistrum balloti TaxID=509963 RepID=UPI002905E010|nr:uncharacterized protein LOC132548153 [Ylistrum balloti]